MSERVVDYPLGAQRYLAETYGLPQYSLRHLKVLVSAGRFPAHNVEVSPRRRAITLSRLDAYAARVIAGGNR